jgi:Sulfotransferase family
MPIFHKDGKTILYVHVPKTGGTSIEVFFESHGFQTEYIDRSIGPHSLNRLRKCSPQHMHANMLASIIDLSKIDYTFMTVRNPLSRIASEYWMHHHQNPAGLNLNAWIEYILSAYERNSYVVDNHIRPQVEFLVPACRVFRQEDLSDRAWITDVAEKLSMSFEADRVGQHMKSPAERRRPNEVIDETRRGMLMKFYERDFAVFGYLQ